VFNLLKLYQDVKNHQERINQDTISIKLKNYLEVDAKQEEFFRIILEKLQELEKLIETIFQDQIIKKLITPLIP
jgi:hypothetical protein